MTTDRPRDLLISPIRHGTVIDHITAGQALNVLRILGITGTTAESVSVATNVASGHVGRKDIVKIENRELRKEEVDRIALIAPNATINIIREFAVTEKKGVETPAETLGRGPLPEPGLHLQHGRAGALALHRDPERPPLPLLRLAGHEGDRRAHPLNRPALFTTRI